MKGGSFFRTSDSIVDCDGDPVSPIGFDCGTGKLAVNEQCLFFITIRCYRAPCDREVIESILTYPRYSAMKFQINIE